MKQGDQTSYTQLPVDPILGVTRTSISYLADGDAVEDELARKILHGSESAISGWHMCDGVAQVSVQHRHMNGQSCAQYNSLHVLVQTRIDTDRDKQ
jgi:adenosyl cobinamide kinase/adenosyl cobinamide phosphate guanylyltransferase